MHQRLRAVPAHTDIPDRPTTGTTASVAFPTAPAPEARGWRAPLAALVIAVGVSVLTGLFAPTRASASTPSGPPVNTALPSVSGGTAQSQVLTGTIGSWTNSPTSYARQWEDCDITGSSCVNITGATASKYTLVGADVGHTVREVVTATNGFGSNSASSAATALVTPPPVPVNTALPVVSGTASPGRTLTVGSNGSWSGAPTSYVYAWQQCDPSGATCAAISAATSRSYTVANADMGYTIRAVVTASNATGSSSATSLPTAVVVAAVFVGDMEAPLTTNFQITTELGAPAPVQVSSPVRLGSYATSMTVANTQKRSELQPINPDGTTVKVMPGTTAWFADSIYLMPGFPTTSGVSNGWQTVLQWKDSGGTQSNSPPIALGIYNGQYTLTGGAGCPSGPSSYRVNLTPATTGIWTDFEFQIHFDTSGQGWADVYVNNQQIVFHYMPPCGTSYPAPYSLTQNLRIGYYRDPTILATGTIVHDEYRMGPTRADVSLYPGS